MMSTTLKVELANLRISVRPYPVAYLDLRFPSPLTLAGYPFAARGATLGMSHSAGLRITGLAARPPLVLRQALEATYALALRQLTANAERQIGDWDSRLLAAGIHAPCRYIRLPLAPISPLDYPCLEIGGGGLGFGMFELTSHGLRLNTPRQPYHYDTVRGARAVARWEATWGPEPLTRLHRLDGPLEAGLRALATQAAQTLPRRVII